MSAAFTYVQVDPNANCPMSASQVFKNIDAPFRVSAVRIYEGEPEGRLCAVTGWSEDEGPVQAFAVRVEDSSAGWAYVVYGGDWGLRLRPADSEAGWDLSDAEQWGETHLVLSDEDDIVAGG
jgi:hypothetical protein